MGKLYIYIASPFCRLWRTSRVLMFAVVLAITAIVPFSMHEVYSGTAGAQTPNTTVNYQARLLLASGALVPDGYYNVEFKLYDSQSGGASAQGACVGGVTDDCVWLETRDYNGGSPDRRVRVVNGYLTVNLGSVTSFGSTIPWSQDLYITMRIGGSGTSPSWDTEMVNSGNRMKLSAVPYAFQAQQLTDTDSGFTSTLSFETPTQNNAILLPDDSGTVCLTIGNCAGVGGTGDILDGGQAGAISIGTTDNTTLALLQNGAAALTVNASQLLRFNAYNCSTFTNGGTLTTDSSGNVTCSDDDSGGSSGDSILIGSMATTDANFVDTTASGTVAGVNWSLNTTPSPDEVSLSISNASDTIAGVVTTSAQTFAGLKTFNSGVTLAASQLLTINSDAFDDLTGSGLIISSGDLQVDTTSASGAFINGGNAFTANSSIGNTGNYSLVIKTNNQNRLLFGGSGTISLYEDTTINGNLTIEDAGSDARIILGSDTGAANDKFFLTVSETNGFSVHEDGSVTPRFNIELGGTVNVRTASQSFNILNGSSVNIFKVDTSTGMVGINDPTPGVALDVNGSGAFTGTLAINGDTITADSNLTVNANGYVRIGDTSVPNIATGDDDLFVEGNVEFDSTFSVASTATFFSTVSVQGSALSVGASTSTNGVLTLLNSSNAYGVSINAPSQTVASATISLPNTLGANDTFCLLTLNNCAAGATGFVDEGNSFGNTAVLGTNDSNSLVFETNNQSAITIASGGAISLQNATDSTTAFSVRNSSGTALFVVDTTNNQLGTNSTTGGSTNSQQLTIRTGNATGASSNTGSILLRSGTSSSGSSGDVSVEAGGFGTTAGAINIGSAYRSSAINIGIVGSTAIQSTVNISNTSGNAVQTIGIGSTTNANSAVSIAAGSTGGINMTSNAIVLGAVSTATTQIEVRDGSSSTVTLLVVDSSNDRIYIGDTAADTTGALLVLDTKSDSGDPTGVNGGMYYNSNSGKFRCYEGGSWKDCLAGGGANTSLSNLASVAVNTNLLPGADDTYDLGSTSLRWQDIYLGPASLHVYCSIAECTSARDWSLGVIETDGATEGNLRVGLAGADNFVITTAGNVQTQGTYGFTSNSVGEKINLYSTSYGVGIESSTFLLWGNQFRWRTTSSAGTEIALLSATNFQIDGTLTVDGTGASTIAGPLTVTTLNTGQGATELYAMNQDVQTTNAVSFATINTGQGANELYDMNQNVLTTSNVTFNQITLNNTADTILSTLLGDNAIDYYLNINAPNGVVAQSGLQVNGNFWVQSLPAAISANNVCYGSANPSGFDSVNVRVLGTCSSLSKYKTNQAALSLGLDELRLLTPREFDWINSEGNHDIGFIAEEVYAVNPLLTTNDAQTGELAGVKYDQMSALLVKAVQQLDVQIQNINARLSVVEAGNFYGNLTVAQDLWVGDDLVVADDATIQSDLIVQGRTTVQDLVVNGKIITAGNAPTAVLGASTTVGEGGVVTLEGNDTAGSILYTPGTENLPVYELNPGAQVSIVFTSSYEGTPRIVLTPTSEKSANITYYVQKSAAGFTIHFTSTPATGQTYSFDYQIMQ